MTLQEMGIKDLERVTIKAYNEGVFGQRQVVKGEPLVCLENIQISSLSEGARVIDARGGYQNQSRVIWEDRDETVFSFTNGTINYDTFALLMGAEYQHVTEPFLVPYSEMLEFQDMGEGVYRAYFAKEIDLESPRFYYEYDCGNLQTRILEGILAETAEYVEVSAEVCEKNVMANYYFNYNKDVLTYTLCKERFANVYTLEATFYLKDENDGLWHSGLIQMPKVHIVSNINLRMGERADPMVSAFNVIAMPERQGKKSDVVCKITLFDEDITGI